VALQPARVAAASAEAARSAGAPAARPAAWARLGLPYRPVMRVALAPRSVAER